MNLMLTSSTDGVFRRMRYRDFILRSFLSTILSLWLCSMIVEVANLIQAIINQFKRNIFYQTLDNNKICQAMNNWYESDFFSIIVSPPKCLVTVCIRHQVSVMKWWCMVSGVLYPTEISFLMQHLWWASSGQWHWTTNQFDSLTHVSGQCWVMLAKIMIGEILI